MPRWDCGSGTETEVDDQSEDEANDEDKYLIWILAPDEEVLLCGGEKVCING